MSGFRLFGRPEAVVREVETGSATSHARPARRAEDLLAPPGSSPRWDTPPTEPDPNPSDARWVETSVSGSGYRAGDTGWTEAAPPASRTGLDQAGTTAAPGWAGPDGSYPSLPRHDHRLGTLGREYPLPPGGHAHLRPPHHDHHFGTPDRAHRGSTFTDDDHAHPGPPTPSEDHHSGTPDRDHRGSAFPSSDHGGFPAPLAGEPRAVEPQAVGAWDHLPAELVPHPAEASALAAAFAADYLSWDEEDSDLRARVLGDYLAARRPVLLGWSGQGRQRADFALPGLVRPDGDGRVLVDVRVRVTPYRRVPGGRPGPPDEPDDAGPAAPAAAPAPAARGWRGLPGRWVRISVAILALGDRLVVDAEEEVEDPWPTPDPELADDLPEESP